MKYSPKYMAAARRRRKCQRFGKVLTSPQEIAVGEAMLKRALGILVETPRWLHEACSRPFAGDVE